MVAYYAVTAHSEAELPVLVPNNLQPYHVREDTEQNVFDGVGCMHFFFLRLHISLPEGGHASERIHNKPITGVFLGRDGWGQRVECFPLNLTQMFETSASLPFTTDSTLAGWQAAYTDNPKCNEETGKTFPGLGSPGLSGE